MKLMKKAGMIRGLALGLAVLSSATVVKASPYASSITNFLSGGTNMVSFYLNEAGGSATVVTYPSGATNASFNGATTGTNLAAGGYTFTLGSDTSYTISVTKTGAGSPTQVSVDGGLNVLHPSAMQIRDVGVGTCAKYGDAFGRVSMAVTGTTTADTVAPAVRGDGIYALTPDLANNAIYGGLNVRPAVASVQSNTLTFTAVPANNATFVMDGATLTWTTNTPGVNQIAIPAAGILATNQAATNLAAALNATLASHPGTLSVGVTSNVVYLLQFAQSTSGASYFSYANPAEFGPFGPAWYYGNSGNNSQVGPVRIAINSGDGTIWVSDSTYQGANVFQFGRNYEFTNQVFSETGDNELTGEHGGIYGVAVKGSLAQGNLQLWTYDIDMPIPQYFNDTVDYTMGNGGVGNFGAPQVTQTGDMNEIYRYDIGSASGNGGAFPVTNTPVWACTLGLNGGFGFQRGYVEIGPNTNYIYAGFWRANLSDGNLQVFNSVTGARVLTSLGGTAQSPTDWAANDPNGNKGVQGLRASPDGRFLAWAFTDSYIGIVNLTNGVPDPSSLIYINNGAGSTTSRGISWDAADNVYAPAFGPVVLREYSLGLTSTCITSNDVTGTNGSFQFTLPSADVTATVANNGSQNYGTAIAGNVNINIGTSSLSSSLAVPFTIGGTATNGVNYTMQTGAIGGGVTVTSNTATSGTITFPAGTQVGNINANLAFTPTASPVVGPTLTVKVSIKPGATYVLGSPGSASCNLSNTGPQYFFIASSPVAGSTSFNRGIPNDYGIFWIGRYGDLNGPSNSVGNVTPKTITLTNFVLKGSAAYGTDYLAGVQPVVIGSTPANGSSSVAFAPGVSNIIVLIGNPVSHNNVLVAPTNLTVQPTLTNAVTGTNCVSSEGYAYTVNTGAPVTLTELDNAEGVLAEVVIWSDPLTNAVNPQARVTYAAASMATNTVLPVVLSPYLYTNGGYPNGNGSQLGSPSNYFDVQLGWPINNENAWENSSGTLDGAYANPPASAVMVQNGWSNVLRMTFDKQSGQLPTSGGVNYFPTTNQFYGNYAMRFDMYLSAWSGALNNNDALHYPQQYAAFGINTQGTNCNWRTNPGAGTAGQNNVTNCDGIWYVIDAADLSLTPADYDGFASPALPNAGSSDFVSSTAITYAETFKTPPFALLDGSGGGTPHNQWSQVSVETRAGTTGLQSVSMFVDQVGIFTGGQAMALTNNAYSAPNDVAGVPSGNWSNGVPMLGYLQPYKYQSDESAFVYYSNLRIVELSPTITTVPSSALALKGSTVTLNSTGSYSQSGLTNTWYRGTTGPATVVSTDVPTVTGFTYSGINYSNATDTLTLANIQNGSNYWAVWNDSAGSVTSYVASVEVVTPPANASANTGANATFTVSGNGPAALTTFQWQTNGVNLTASTKYLNPTTATLTVSNVNVNDTLVTYDCVVGNNVTNLVGLYLYTNAPALSLTTPGASLTLNTAPTSAVVSPAAQTNLWGSTASFTVAASGGTPAVYTYKWYRGTNAVAGATTSALTLSNVTTAVAGTYTCAVSNTAGGLLSTPGVLTVIAYPPTFKAITASGTSVAMNYTTTNGFDNTNAYTLLSSPVANGTYTNTTATFTINTNGGFTVTVPEHAGSSNMFYILQHKP